VSIEEHRARAPAGIRCAIVAVSDTRSVETDESGKEMVRRVDARGHRAVSRTVVPDEPVLIGAELRRLLADPDVDAVLIAGGTGIAPRDATVEVVRAFLDREIPGFGEFFRMLSFRQIGPAAMLSRAVAGVARGKPIFCLPGSPAAVALGLDELVLPELGHVIEELRR
jgi:molybdenum cofactor biosynthesis protein B